MSDRYIPTPQEAENLLNGRTDAEDRGNPHPFNSPAWHVWNNGYHAAVSKFVRAALPSHQGAGEPLTPLNPKVKDTE